MKCPECDSKTEVLETRQTRRRRACICCGLRFTTTEILAGLINSPAQVRVAPTRTRTPAVKKPAAKRVVAAAKPVLNAQARASARRLIEERREARLLDDDDWFSDDNDYLSEI